MPHLKELGLRNVKWCHAPFYLYQDNQSLLLFLISSSYSSYLYGLEGKAIILSGLCLRDYYFYGITYT